MTKKFKEVKEGLALLGAQTLLAIGLLAICAVNAKADTVENNGLATCNSVQVLPMQNGLVMSDGVENYTKTDIAKVYAMVGNAPFETYNNKGSCTVRFDIDYALKAIQKDTTTQDRLKAGKPLIIGVRGSSIPVSYEQPKGSGNYQGLAVDVCLSAVEKMKKIIPSLRYEFREVSSSDRIPMLNDGRIDIECGSTTANDSRLKGNKDNKGVVFSIPYYWATIVAVTKADNKIDSLSELDKGNTLIYTKGTTTEKAIEKYSIVFKSKNEKDLFRKVIGKDHDDSFNLLNNKGSVFANDDILIYALIAKSGNAQSYKVLTDRLSVEPYAVMTRQNDNWLTVQIDKSINEDMKNSSFNKMYDKWFMQSIQPFNQSMNIEMSRRLKDTVRFPNNAIGG